jgi:hypothetical protein
MTNEEIANKVCEKYQKSIIPTEEECLAYSSAMEALELKEQQLIEKACKFLKSYRQDTPDGLGYIAGIVNDKTIEDFKKYMEGE